ncbi:MAG TPA: HlyD family secretion protein [Caulobacteraceae bacterium]|nr:HlyD family secretion protein [Caulobacteraceae bacterium]
MADETARGDRSKRRASPLLMVGAVGLIAVVAIGAFIWWLGARNYEATDDAFVDAHIVRLAPQIAGRVTAVLAVDNQLVRAGAPLLEIDSADVATRVAQARAQKAQAQAQVANARDQIRVSEETWRQALADVAAARAPADNAAADLARYLHLAAINRLAVSQQQIDQARSAARQTAAQRDSAAKAAQTRAAQIAAARTQVTSGEDQVRAAQAQLDEASVNLGYTRVVAPVSGHVTQKTVAVGNYVQPGAQVMAIVPLELWVTANFKETQLARIRPGQSVAIKVDACPEDHIPGHVESIQRGAGQAFGVLPPENATGNYVKVVQRVPVKIVFDRTPRDCPIGPGMSVIPRVRVR